MDAIKDLNRGNRASASWITCADRNSNVPRILWHLKRETEDDLNDFLENRYPNNNATVGENI